MSSSTPDSKRNDNNDHIYISGDIEQNPVQYISMLKKNVSNIYTRLTLFKQNQGVGDIITMYETWLDHNQYLRTDDIVISALVITHMSKCNYFFLSSTLD